MVAQWLPDDCQMISRWAHDYHLLARQQVAKCIVRVQLSGNEWKDGIFTEVIDTMIKDEVCMTQLMPSSASSGVSIRGKESRGDVQWQESIFLACEHTSWMFAGASS